jgi:hypothetical protein
MFTRSYLFNCWIRCGKPKNNNKREEDEDEELKIRTGISPPNDRDTIGDLTNKILSSNYTDHGWQGGRLYQPYGHFGSTMFYHMSFNAPRVIIRISPKVYPLVI